MNIELPQWFLCLGALGFVIWIIAGIQVFKAARAMRYRAEMQPHFPSLHQPPQDDADWWKHND